MAFFAPLTGPLFKIAVPDTPGSELRNSIASTLISNAANFLGAIVVYTLFMGAINGYFASMEYKGILQGAVCQVSTQLISLSFYEYLKTYIYYTNPNIEEDLSNLISAYIADIVKGIIASKAPIFG